MARNEAARSLRRLLEGRDHVVAPGTFHALDARLAERTGHDAVYISGGATNLGQYGYPDGLIGMAEMRDNAERIANATDLPVIADGDTGYGGVHNVRRTVREYDRAGIAALHIEDQQWPKRSGHAGGKTVVDREEATARIRAAVDARDEDDRDIVVIARTDAYGAANADWDEHVARGRLFTDLGADLVFCEMPTPDREDWVRYAEEVHETHPEARFLCNYSPSFQWTDEDDPITFEELGDLGYGLVIVSTFGVLAAVRAVHEHMRDMAENGAEAQWHLEEAWEGHDGFESSSAALYELMEFEEFKRIERRYDPTADQKYGESKGYDPS